MVSRRAATVLAGLALAAAPAGASAATLPLVTSWGGANSTAPGQFSLIEDVSVAPNGDVFTVENGGGAADRVQRFNGTGTPLQPPFGTEGSGDSAWFSPISLIVSPASEVFVVDATTSVGRVSRFTAAGVQIGPEWGADGQGPGQWANPEGLAFGSGQVYVADRGNNQIDAYSVTGTPGVSWGGFGSAPGFFNRVLEVSVGPSGDVYAADRDNFRVQRFSPTGAFIRVYGGTQGTGPGQLGSVSNVAVDSAGDVWIGDASEQPHQPLRRRRHLQGELREDRSAEHATGRPVLRPGRRPADRGPLPRLRAHHQGKDRRRGPPPPVLGRAVNVQRVRGTVRIKLPAGSAGASQVKGTGFVPLSQARQIPVRSLLDTRRGTVRLTSATGDRLGHAVRRRSPAGCSRRSRPAPGGARGIAEMRLKGSSFSRLQPRQEGEHEPALEAHGPPPARKRQGPLPNPRTPLGRHRARNDLDGDRPLRRHADQRQARQGRRTRLQAQEDDRREGRARATWQKRPDPKEAARKEAEARQVCRTWEAAWQGRGARRVRTHTRPPDDTARAPSQPRSGEGGIRTLDRA